MFNEQIKVRTFSLELYTNIDELSSSLPQNDPEIELTQKIKSIVGEFLKSKSINKTADFADFKDILCQISDVIAAAPEAIVSKKIHVTVQRHLNLVDLQRQIKPRPPSSSPAKAILRTLMKSGLLTPNLCALTEKAKALKLKFNPYPPLPQMTNMYNIYSLIDSVNRLAPEFTETGKWLLNHSTVLTFKELCASIKESCLKIREELLREDNYSILTIGGKSQSWMADIAIRFLPEDKLPKEVISVGIDDCVVNQTADLLKTLESNRSSHYLIFDDACYSGKQLKDYLFNLTADLKKPLAEPVRLTFIYGFMTDVNVQFYKENLEEFNIHLNVMSSHKISNMMQQLDNEKLPEEKIRQAQGVADFVDRLSIEEIRMWANKTLVVTEWKTPDGFSTCSFITKGFTWRYRPELDEWVKGSPNSAFDEIPVINEIQPPYRSKSKELSSEKN